MIKLRVLLLITNLGKGGAQRVVHDHAVGLREYYDLHEAVFDRDHDQRLYNSGQVLHDLTGYSWFARLGPIGRLFSRALALRALVAREGYDVVISHLDGANWVNVLSFSGAKKITVLHGSLLYDQGQTQLRRWVRIHVISRLIYDRADVTVAVSSGLERELITVCRLKKVVKINNFFETESIRSFTNYPLNTAESLIFSSRNVLITSGRLTQGKRQAELLYVVDHIKRRGCKVKLVILGDGEYRNELIDLSHKLGLSLFEPWSKSGVLCVDQDVYFLGYVSNPYKYLRKSTLFLFPSAWEGFPLALCEAMICGVPVLSADCPTGPREILAPHTIRDSYDLRLAEFTDRGVLMPMIESPSDLDVWVETVIGLLADVKTREHMATNAKHAMRSLDRDIVLHQWKTLIEKTIHAE